MLNYYRIGSEEGKGFSDESKAFAYAAEGGVCFDAVLRLSEDGHWLRWSKEMDAWVYPPMEGAMPAWFIPHHS